MTTSPTRVAILATSEKTQQQLSSLLEDAGLDVVSHDLPSDGFLSKLEATSADVLLVDLSEENGSETDIIDTLLDFDALPIFFNDSSPAGGGANALWAKKLARKLSSVAESQSQTLSTENATTLLEQAQVDDNASFQLTEPDEDALLDTPLSLGEMTLETQTENQTPTDVQPGLAAPEKKETQPVELDLPTNPGLPASPDTNELPDQATAAEQKPDGAAVNIWVLGASLGGPQAVRQFLAAIKADLPVAFVLAQHIGANHISLLAEQLNRVTPFTVLAGTTGHLIKHHEVILAPADKDIRITDDGYLSLVPADKNAIYSPSIDNVMDAVARQYGNMAGTIVFSGMGDDGARGCESIAKYGGIIWAQDVDSCVISSMPDQARKTNTVTYSANPQALAERLYDYYCD